MTDVEMLNKNLIEKEIKDMRQIIDLQRELIAELIRRDLGYKLSHLEPVSVPARML